MKRQWIAALIAAGWLAGLAGIAHAQDIVLGYLPTSGGPFATFSKTNLIAAEMALEEINAAGGIAGRKLKIVSFDTAGKPDQAVVGVRKLAEDDKVLAIVGPFTSSECRVVFPAGERAGVATMSMGSSAPKLAASYKFAFRNTTDEAFLFERVLRALKEKGYAIDTAGIAYATDDVVSKTMGETVLPGLMKKAGIDPRLSVTFQSQAFDMAPQVSQLVSQPTDLIAVGSGPEPATRLVLELRRQGHKGRLVAGSTIADPELPRLMGKAGDGTVIPTAFYAGLNERTKRFETEFLRRTKVAGIERSASSQFDAATYDIVLIYAEAIRRAKATGDPSKLAEERAAIKDELRKMTDFPALEGPISFGASGDAQKPVYIVEMQNGRWTLLASYPASE